MSEQTFSYPIDETTLNRLVKEYSYISSDPKNEYIVFFASKPKFSISIFINKKKEYKVVFQGELARIEASRMGFNTSIPKKIRTCPPRQNKLDIFLPQIGSDEVGFGDLFGPIIVASSYIDSALLEYITSLGVTDSKLLTDEKILEIGPKLISKVPYSELYLPQEKYNQIEQNGFNMNKCFTLALSGGIMRYVEKFLYDKESVLIPQKGTLNNVFYINEPFWSVDTMFYTEMKKENIAKYVYLFVKGKDLNSMNAGSAVPSMTTEILNAIEVVIPSDEYLEKFENIVSPMFKQIKQCIIENENLASIRHTLLPKLMNGEIEV